MAEEPEVTIWQNDRYASNWPGGGTKHTIDYDADLPDGTPLRGVKGLAYMRRRIVAAGCKPGWVMFAGTDAPVPARNNAMWSEGRRPPRPSPHSEETPE
jgi:hypothetical protein